MGLSIRQIGPAHRQQPDWVTIWAAAATVRFTGAAWIGLFIFGFLSWLISTQLVTSEHSMAGSEAVLACAPCRPEAGDASGAEGVGNALSGTIDNRGTALPDVAATLHASIRHPRQAAADGFGLVR
jgi:hypothetical protein